MAHYLDKDGLTLYDTLLKSDANPQALGTAAAGTAKKVSRADHVHPMPDADDIAYDNNNSVADKIDDLAAAISGGQDFSSLSTGVVHHTSGQAALAIATAAEIVSAIGTTPVNRATADAAGNNIASTYALKSEITGIYKYMGSVQAVANLPASPSAGDVYNLETETVYGPAGTNVAWTGSAWDALGGLFSIESITTAEINALFAA